MRDRRLIIPAVALLVAIAAVPIVLGSSSESSVTPPATVADPDAVAVEPAVLAVQEIGVRDYRKRLSELEQKNPFGSRFDPKPDKDLKDANATQAGGAASAVSGGSTSPVVPSTGGSGTFSRHHPAGDRHPPEPMIVVSRIHATTKIVGRDQSIPTRRSLGRRPSVETRAVVLFLGNVIAGTAAQFIVSRNCSNVNGDGTGSRARRIAIPHAKESDTGYPRYADGKSLRLRVTDIPFQQFPERV